MKARLVILLLILYAIPLSSQITIKNQLEFTNWEEYGRQIVENWTDMSYQRDFFQLGMRYEINRPPDPFIFPRDSLLENFELTYRYAEFYYKDFTATVGNFYTMFGRGMVLRTYEDRNLRVDNNLEGIKAEHTTAFCSIQALAGKMRDKYNRRKNAIYGIDGEFNISKNILLGGSCISQQDAVNDMSNIWASRLSISREWVDLYFESAKPDWSNRLSHYLALTGYYSKFALTAEYKDYDQLSFKNDYGTEYNAAPALTREHSYTLLNRHPHALNQNDEKGYQLELTYLPSEKWEIVLNHSLTRTHGNKQVFKEYYGDVHYIVKNFDTHIITAWNYDLTTNTENITSIFDFLYNINPITQVHFSIQHQHVINKYDKSEYDDDLLLLEFSRSPLYSIALVGEYTNKYKLNNVTMDVHTWLYGQLTLNLMQSQQISILYGSRQEGFVCVGGICRYEPEFNGLEIKLISRF
ncbi:hypothetical protein B6I21_00955 [candidate division KSB1 bacterium 4572_119]|nr:MAG: hypothetical protein B6I21_00955 [candidate division KSB1 bacterium 4572_119]